MHDLDLHILFAWIPHYFTHHVGSVLLLHTNFLGQLFPETVLWKGETSYAFPPEGMDSAGEFWCCLAPPLLLCSRISVWFFTHQSSPSSKPLNNPGMWAVSLEDTSYIWEEFSGEDQGKFLLFSRPSFKLFYLNYFNNPKSEDPFLKRRVFKVKLPGYYLINVSLLTHLGSLCSNKIIIM